MLQKYIFIPVVVSMLGGLAIWSHHLESKLPSATLSQKSFEMKLSQPRRKMSSVNAVIEPLQSLELEIEPVESD
jgi:hypothetical protein